MFRILSVVGQATNNNKSARQTTASETTNNNSSKFVDWVQIVAIKKRLPLCFLQPRALANHSFVDFSES